VKKILLPILICIFLISGCAINADSNYDDQISELEERNRILEAELEEKNNYIKRIKEKEDLFTIFAYLSTDTYVFGNDLDKGDKATYIKEEIYEI